MNNPRLIQISQIEMLWPVKIRIERLNQISVCIGTWDVGTTLQYKRVTKKLFFCFNKKITPTKLQSSKMGPKKAPKNDFWYFMQDQKSVLRRQGYEWNTMDELVTLCSPRWKQTSDRDRARFLIFANIFIKFSTKLPGLKISITVEVA